jgi:DNA-binding SARP family transcriptional activator
VAEGEQWEIRLCGAIDVQVGDRRTAPALPGRQGRLLLAYLVWHRDRSCPRSELIDVLWPDDPPPATDSALSALLSKLRRALGPDVLVGRSELRFAAREVRVDAEAAMAAVARAEAAIEAGRFSDALASAREALATDLQTFLPDGSGLWVAERRHECETARLRALEAVAIAGARLGGGELGAAEQAAEAAVAAAPFRESSHRALMEVHEAAGNPAEALRVFERLRVLLRDELGTSPGAAAIALHERLLRGETVPVAPAPPRPAAVTWPPPLESAVARHRLVNRTTELAFLDGCLEQAQAGSRQLVLVAGEAGIGKTRMVAELSRRAHERGAAVLYGRFDEETLAPYQPVVEMIRGWAAGAPLDVLRDRLGPRAGELGVLLPELGPVPAESVVPVSGADADARRLRFFDAVAALLAELAGGAPVVLVFDDLQWGDRPTLQLLRHLVRSPAPARALFAGTCREAELPAGHPLSELVGVLRREGTLKRLELGGLEEAEVGELIAALGVRAPAPGFVAALHGETEGNPFFVEEVVGHLRAEGERAGAGVTLAEAGVPDGVREVTSRRLRLLTGPAREAVIAGAVIGREFDFVLLERVLGDGGSSLEGDALVTALEEAVEARVLRESGQAGHYAFTHALVRATLYDGISKLRRARLHGRVGEALAALRGGDVDAQLPQLAHHFAMAAPVEHPERAIDFALAAARRADRLMAWEEAAEHYREALRARELAGAADDRVRGELLVALGDSCERAGDEEGARTSFRAAADTARGLGDPALLARAALGFAGPWSMLGRSDPRRVDVLEEALGALGSEDTPLRARLLARLALELYYSGDAQRRVAVSASALELARRLDDPRTLATCLIAHHYALWRPETVEERLEVASELRRVADRTGDPELELEGAGWTVVDLLELGDVQGADIQIAAASKLAEALHRPLYLWWTSGLRCARAQLAGSFDEAERLAGETLAIGQRGQAENAMHYYAQAIFNIRREQGRLAEVEDAVRRFVEIYPAVPAWRAALSLLLAETGRLEEAREEFAALLEVELPSDANWLIGNTLLAEVCGLLGDGARAPVFYERLLPYAGRNVVVGRASTCSGSASRVLGMLATAMRRWDEADAHFASAMQMHERMGARPWRARTAVGWAGMLLARRGRGDKARARELLAEAVVEADALGMTVVAEQARALVPAGPAGPGGAARDVAGAGAGERAVARHVLKGRH